MAGAAGPAAAAEVVSAIKNTVAGGRLGPTLQRSDVDAPIDRQLGQVINPSPPSSGPLQPIPTTMPSWHSLQRPYCDYNS